MQQNQNSFYFVNEEQIVQKGQIQIGVSACGPTAVINTLICLNMQVPEYSNQEWLEILPARLRNYETKSIYQYLLSRSKAGTIHIDLKEGIQKVTKNNVTSVFCTFDHRDSLENFRQFLHEIMINEGVPILTENLFFIGNDAWHHQTVYGIDEANLYLTNPVEKVKLSKCFNWICSNGFMIIPEDHVHNRQFMKQEEIEYLSEEPWSDFNVLEQIFQIQNKKSLNDQKQLFVQNTYYSGLTIPYGGLAGITISFQKQNEKILKLLQKYGCYEMVDMLIYKKSTKICKINLNKM